MTRVLALPQSVHKHGYRKARRSRRVDLEKYGQLNMFRQAPGKEARVVAMHAAGNPFERALELEEAGDLPAAVPYYKEATKMPVYAADAFCNLGILMSQQMENAAAVDYFSRALVENPRHLEAHYNLGNVYADNGEKRLASLHYELAIRIDPSFDSGYYNLAVLLMQEGKLEEAEERLMQYKTMASDTDRQGAQQLLDEIRKHLNHNV